MEFKFTRDEFQKILDTFSHAVKEKKYEPLPYNLWKYLSKFARSKEYCKVIISKNYINFYNDTGSCFKQFFGYDLQSSFNAFLNNYYNNEVESVSNNKITEVNTVNAYIKCDDGSYSPLSLGNATTLESSYAVTTNSTSTGLHFNANENICYKEKEKEMNTNKILNFDFGFITDNNSIRMSPYGMAVKNQSGTYVAYNAGEIIDVDVFNIKADKMFMKVPVAIEQIAVGDILMHNRKPCYVTAFDVTTGNPVVIDVFMGERKEILPQKSPFGFNFATKIVSLLDGFGGMTADAANPFGNMWMFMLMGDGKMDDMLPFLMMNQTGDMNFENPMMMYFLMKDGNKNDMLPLMLMMGQQNGKREI